jgi:hypothetical protein
MSSSLSILTASPNKKMYCARFANCHMFRILCSMLGSGAGSSASISSLARFLDPMAAMERAAEVTREVVGERADQGGGGESEQSEDYATFQRNVRSRSGRAVRAGVVRECGELMRVKGHLVNRVKPQNPSAKTPRRLTKRMQASEAHAHVCLCLCLCLHPHLHLHSLTSVANLLCLQDASAVLRKDAGSLLIVAV